MADHENQERELIQDEILVLLPYKSVVQFMCTSKRMYDRIRSHNFAKKFLDQSLQSNTNRCLLLSIPGPPTDFFALPLDDRTDETVPPERLLDPPLISFKNRTDIVGHSAGLVCIASHNYPRYSLSGSSSSSAYSRLLKFNRRRRPRDNPTLAMWNPSLCTYHRVPHQPWFELPAAGGHVKRLPPSYGFGLNPRIDGAHEIIKLSQCFDPDTGTYTTDVDIYSIESSWQSLARLDAARYGRFEIGGGYLEGKAFRSPFVNGHMHWLMEIADRGPVRILAFNIQSQGFLDYAVPQFALPHLELRIAGVGESLLLMEYRSDRVVVWRMTEYGNEGSWAALYNVTSRYVEDRFVSLIPLVQSNVKSATLFLGNDDTTAMVYGGTSYLQSFMLGDQPKCPSDL